MPGELNAPYGGAEGYNGVTQGGRGALLGGNRESSITSTLKSQQSNLLDPGTMMALKAVLPALVKKGEPKTGPTAPSSPTVGSEGGSNKQLGQAQGSSKPRSVGGPGVSADGNGANIQQLIRTLFGGS